MPGQAHAPRARAGAVSSPSTSSARSTSAQDTVGNAALADQIKARSAGQLTWEAALGEALGGKLYRALADKLSDAELRSAAEGAVSAATKSLDAFLQGEADATEQEAAAAFVTALDGHLKRMAGDAVAGELGEILREFVDDNPVLIASAALGAAAAYILSNQEIGMVDGKVKLGGGHALVGGVDLGRTMDIAVEQVRLGYRYASGDTKAELVGDYFTDDASWKVTGRYERQLGQGEHIALSGSHREQADLSRSRLDLDYRDGGLGAGAWWQRDRELGGQTDTVGGHLTAQQDDWSAYLRGQASTDGSRQAAAGFQRTQDDRSWGVEGYSGRDASGQTDRGVRAVFKWRF